MNYKKQIKDPRWQKKRLEILNRDNWKCKVCSNSEKTLHVHHVKYLKNKMIWEYANYYLITLCESCHSEWHRIYDNAISESLVFSIVDVHRISTTNIEHGTYIIPRFKHNLDLIRRKD